MDQLTLDQMEHATTTDGNGRDNPDKGADSMSVKEAAALFGVSERTVQRYVRKLSLPVEHVYTIRGRQLQLNQDALDRIAGYLSERLAAIPSPAAEQRQAVARVSDSENGAETRVPSNGQPGVGQGVRQGVEQDRALAPLGEGISAKDLRALLVDAFTEALQTAQLRLPAPPPRFGDRGIGRVLTAGLYGALTLGLVAVVAFTLALAHKAGAIALPWVG